MSRYNITAANLVVDGCEFSVENQQGLCFRFRIRHFATANGKELHFVDVQGPDGWQYIGIFDPYFMSREDALRVTSKSVTGERFDRARKGFAWACERILHDAPIPDGCAIEGYQESIPVRETPKYTGEIVKWEELRGHAPESFGNGLVVRKPRARKAVTV